MKDKYDLTLIVPSRVLAMTVLFKASVASPVMHRPARFLLALWDLLATSGGQGPTSKVLRCMPDCMFHIWIPPVDELAIPKFPQADTQTA